MSLRLPLNQYIQTAVVQEWGKAPQLVSIPTPYTPSPSDDLVQVRVSGAALHSLVRVRASGKHYSATTLPHAIGVDGVGSLADGREVYFTTLGTDRGSFTEAINLSRCDVHVLPAGSDKLQVAALVNPAMSSWMAVRRRAIALPPRFTVLILGATSMSGKLAVPLLRRLGAGRVIGCSRSEKKMKDLDLDDRIVLGRGTEDTDFASLGHVDVVLDYLFGEPAKMVLKGLRPQRRMQWIQIGSVVGQEIAFSYDLVRGRDVIVMGAGIGSWSLKELQEELPELLEAMRELPWQQLNIRPISNIGEEWAAKSLDRTVLTMNSRLH